MPRRMCLLVAGLVVLTGCSRSFSDAYTTRTPSESSDRIAFVAAAFDLYAAGPVPPAAQNAALAGVLDTLNRYLDAGVLTPLRSAGPAGDLAPLFTKPAAARVVAVGPDRSAFIDEGLPVVRNVRRQAAAAGLSGLAGEDGTLSVITAGLDLRLIGQVDGETVTVVRTGEIVLVPEGGAWRIDGYDLKVTRNMPSGTSTTAVRS